MSRNPFAFKIDYAAAMREDERWIAVYSSREQQVIAADLDARELDAMADGYRVDVVDWLLYEPKFQTRLAAFGLTEEQAREMAATYFMHSLGHDLGDMNWIKPWIGNLWDLPTGWIHRGEALLKRFCDIQPMTEEKRAAAEQHARRSLARHKRNAAKFGQRAA